MRIGFSGGALSLALAMIFFGVPLTEILYDSRFAAAGPIVMIVAFIQIPQIICLPYDQAALAAGDSRRFFFLTAVKAGLQITLIVIGVETAGLLGALAGQGLAAVLVYPMVVWLVRRHGAWDPLHDATFTIAGLSLGSLALWIKWDAITALAVEGL